MSILTNQLKIWRGDFGKAYTKRNALTIRELNNMYKKMYGLSRTDLNRLFLGKISRSIKILEVGSNIGNQLILLQRMGFKHLFGIEPQRYAVEFSKKRTKGINIIEGNAFDIPFKDGYFDLVFTSGVLIHISPRDIKKTLREIYRCSNKYIWGYEYYSPNYEEVTYRGKKGLLWKADFLKMYLKLFPDLKVVKVKHLRYISEKDKIDIMFLLKK